MEKLESINWEKYLPYITEYGMKFLMAIVIFVVGKWAAKICRMVFRRILSKTSLDDTLVSFLVNIIYSLLLVVVIIAALGQLGVQTASLVAILGAAGLAVGLALQGSLANFAAGVMIIGFRPFKKGDFVEVAGTAGVVNEVSIFTTTLLTGDNKTIIIPNASVTGGAITNYSMQKNRRVDMVFGIGYDDDIKKAKKILEDILKKDKRVLANPAYTVALSELADSSVNFVVRPWVKSGDFWAVKFETNEKVKEAFDKAGISIPYPQQDVHMHNVPAKKGKK